MFSRLREAPAALALLAAVAVTTMAAVPTFWSVSTESEFLKGEVENLSVDSFGRLTLGPASEPLYESNSPFLWTLVAAPDGTVYAGSGNEGQVFRITPDGRSSVFFDSEELEVHALALAPGGGLYVGTSPDGRIYRVDAAGTATTFFDPADRYIWSLAVDRSGNVFAATGDKGVIYRIAPNGTGAPFYQTKATHAITLAFDGQGRLLAGTENPGRVFQIDANGKPFVLLDSNYSEIHQIRVDPNGVIYVTAVRGRNAGASPTPPPEPSGDTTAATPIPSVSTEITAIAVIDSSPASSGGSGGSQTSAPPRGPAAGAIFRILPDGSSDLLWESRDDTPYDIAFEPNGALLVATGDKGKIYRLSGDPYQPTLVTRANAEQVTSLATGRDNQVIFTTSNPGKLFRLSASRADKGTYTSDVRDATTVAAWGVLKWQASTPTGTRIEIATRSGNTRTPDETWSDWSDPYTTPDGSAVTSPRARYLQWRAVFTGARGEAPLLTSVTAAYLPRNLRPRVTSITIYPPGTVFQRPFPTDPEIAGFEGDTPDRRAAAQAQGGQSSSPTIGRRGYEKGLLTFVWRAEDENRDDLSYDVEYRREGDTAWKVLKRGLTDPIMVWDTTSVPNGRYLLRIVASDAPSNAPATALTGALESTTFDVDNAPPSIRVTSVRRDNGRTTIAFEVRDDQSAVQKADYSLDGNRWQTIYPKDGIADSRVEEFELVIDGGQPRGVILRAADTLNNVASASADTPTTAPASGRR